MGGLSDLTRTGVGLRVLFRGLDGFVHIPNVVPRELVLAARTMPCFIVFGLSLSVWSCSYSDASFKLGSCCSLAWRLELMLAGLSTARKRLC